jgi:hypothetical protein
MKLALGVMLAGLAQSADAVDVLSTNGTGPVGNCQAALPAYEGQTRKRPLAVVNEGSGTAFVTCAFTSEEVSLNVVSFGTRLSNLSAVSATVNCTAVIGEELENAEYIVKSITLAPHDDGDLTWTSADNEGLLFDQSIAISCALPSFVGLNRNRATTLLSILPFPL